MGKKIAPSPFSIHPAALSLLSLLFFLAHQLLCFPPLNAVKEAILERNDFSPKLLMFVAAKRKIFCFYIYFIFSFFISCSPCNFRPRHVDSSDQPS